MKIEDSDRLRKVVFVAVAVGLTVSGVVFGRMHEARYWREYFAASCMIVKPKEHVRIDGRFVRGSLTLGPIPGHQLGVCQMPEVIEELQ